MLLLNSKFYHISWFLKGACEAVLEALKGSNARARAGAGTGTGGLLVQEGCRALRHLCYRNRQGLKELFRLGVCDVILGERGFDGGIHFLDRRERTDEWRGGKMRREEKVKYEKERK